MNAQLMSFGAAYAQGTIFSALNSNMAQQYGPNVLGWGQSAWWGIG